MKDIELRELTIHNFKGIREQNVLFSHTTNIYGANAAGKTTLADAFCWLLFNADSTGATKFDVRPLDADGRQVDNVEIMVAAVLDVDGEEITLQKVQKQNWVKKRGSDTAKLQGNVNSYEINTFPAGEGEFRARVAGLIASADNTPPDRLFRMLTDPRYFANLPWKEQREAIMQFVPGVTDADVIDSDSDKYAPIAEDVAAAPVEKCIEKAAKAMTKLKDRQKELPIRIDQAGRSLVEVPDAAEVAAKKAELTGQLAEVQKQRDDAGAAFSEADSIRDEIMSVKFAMSGMETAAADKVQKDLRDANAAYSAAESEANRLYLKKTSLKEKLDALQDALPEKEAELRRRQRQWVELRDVTALSKEPLKYLQCQDERFMRELKKIQDGFAAECNRVFNEDSVICPTCGREYPPEQVSEMRKSFQREHERELKYWEDRYLELLQKTTNEVCEAGNLAVKAFKDTKAEIEKTTAELEEVKARWTEAAGRSSRAYEYRAGLPHEASMAGNAEYQALQDRLDGLQAKLAGLDNGEALKQQLAEREQTIRAGLDTVSRVEAAMEMNAKVRQDMDALRAELRAVSQQVADQEQKMYLLEELSKAKMEMLAGRINRQFEVINVKLFDVRINGGVKPTCEITARGVPYSSLNSAGKMQAGLDMIRALQKLHGVSAPIWLDNRESVVEIPDVDAQIINLYVSAGDAALRVENR